jgi:crossover junction endodeoxyribonuclease RuvC
VQVLGIDPGTQIVGYGFVKFETGRCEKIDFGEIRIPKGVAFSKRLKQIHDSVLELIDRVQPDAVSIEEIYVTSNAKTTIRLSHARGVILLAVVQRGIPIAEYAPREIKMAVLGRGGAGKQQVQWMVCQLLHLDPSKLSEDAADALAAALCHGFRSGSAISQLEIK